MVQWPGRAFGGSSTAAMELQPRWLHDGGKAVRGDELEHQVWSDVESFLRNPEPVLAQLHARLESDVKESDQTRKQVTRLEGLLAQKATERSRVVGLYRRGRLTDADLDARRRPAPTRL